MDSPSSDGGEGDRDDALDEDMEALRRACLLSPNDHSASESEPQPQPQADDDADLLRRLKSQLQESPPQSPSSLEPFSTPPPSPLHFRGPLSPVPQFTAGSDDDDDDFQTLRNIQRALARYEAG